VVARLNMAYAGTNLFDDPGPFMTEHDRLWNRIELVAGNQIRVTHSRSHQPDQTLIFTRAFQADVFNCEGRARGS
jgi:hypothetical protein